MGLFTQAFSLLAEPPGNLIYHLVLVFSIAEALQASFVHWRASAFPQARRTVIGLAILILPQVLLFALSGLGWQGLINLEVLLPPLDRAMTMISLVWIIWLWVFPEPSRIADATTALFTLFILFIVIGLTSWGQQPPGTFYNTTLQDLLWQFASLGLIGMGILTLLVRRPNGWDNGIAVLTLTLFGHALHILFGRTSGNFPGIVRMAYMAAYPFLITLAQRFPILSSGKLPAIKQDTPVVERRHYSTNLKTFHALLALAIETKAEKVSHAITRAIAQTMLADLCFLIYFTENKNRMVIASGYDLIREENLEGASLDKNAIPMLTNAIQRGRPLRLPASSTSADTKVLSDLLGLSDLGHMMTVPIITPEKDKLGGLMVLSPFSERAWREEDQAFLSNISSALVPIILRSHPIETALESTDDQIDSQDTVNQEQENQTQAVHDKSINGQEQDTKLETIFEPQQETPAQTEQPQKESDESHAQEKQEDAPDGEEMEFIEAELRATLGQVARLQTELDQANMKLLQLDKGQTGVKSTEQADVIVSIAQELRQPMSSVIGYTDLLLSESVGILGSLQRKFIERIRAASERIGSLIDNMIHVTMLDAGLSDLKPEPVDLNAIIDNAMSYTSSQLREKDITLHLDLPKDIQAIYADREALQQILIHLLQNAGAATPIEGTIMLKLQTQSEEEQDYFLLQVTDSGGGILAEDIPRVFSRLYRANNVLIQGVGDTGVGLSIAKTLTEAQKGRIWVESEAGVGATFSVLLPMSKGS